MNVVDAIKRVSSQTCHVSDEMIWDNLPDFQKLAVARLFKDDVEEMIEESYDRGKEDGREDSEASGPTEREIEDIKVEALNEIKTKLRPVYDLIKPIIESLEY